MPAVITWGKVTFAVVWWNFTGNIQSLKRNPQDLVFRMRAKKFPISLIFISVKLICCIDQQKADWFEGTSVWVLFFCQRNFTELLFKFYGHTCRSDLPTEDYMKKIFNSHKECQMYVLTFTQSFFNFFFIFFIFYKHIFHIVYNCICCNNFFKQHFSNHKKLD